jgi:hypothetical protein
VRKILEIISKALIGLIVLAIFAFLILKIPVKKAININTTGGRVQYISEKDTKIFCTCLYGGTGPIWMVKGKGSTIFTEYSYAEPLEFVELEGNRPKKINLDMSGSIFVFEGNYVGEKEDGYNNKKHKVFKVKNWDVLYPIKWDNNSNKSKNTITIGDTIFSDEISNY